MAAHLFIDTSLYNYHVTIYLLLIYELRIPCIISSTLEAKLSLFNHLFILFPMPRGSFKFYTNSTYYLKHNVFQASRINLGLHFQPS